MFRARSFAVAATVIAVSALPALAQAGVLEDRLADTRSKASKAKGELESIDSREQSIEQDVSRLNDRIASIEVPLRELEGDVERLEYRISQRERRIEELRRQREQQRLEIVRLTGELADARRLLTQRVIIAYKNGDIGMLEQLAGSGDLQDLFEREEALSQVVGLDDRVIGRISKAERSIRVKRARNVQLRKETRDAITKLDAERAEIDGQRARVQQSRDDLASAKSDRDAALRKLQEREKVVISRLDDLEDDARTLQDAIENGSMAYSGVIGGVSASGLIWPVGGAVVSPFGPRWGKLHAGIDIAAVTGTPIMAAASGVVTYASEMSGYGNLVIVQHAGGLSTAYAHQSQIASSVGQLVSQGQVIGYVGCTGHCYGPHLHFETRVNGSATDPMQYL